MILFLSVNFPHSFMPNQFSKNFDDVFSEGNQEAVDKLNCAKVLEGNWFTIPYIASKIIHKNLYLKEKASPPMWPSVLFLNSIWRNHNKNNFVNMAWNSYFVTRRVLKYHNYSLYKNNIAYGTFYGTLKKNIWLLSNRFRIGNVFT